MIQRNQMNRLLVEGKTELRLLPYLLENNGVEWPEERVPVRIRDMDGFSNFWRNNAIETELKASGVKSVGLIFDADEPEDRRWETVMKHCKSFATDFPDTPQNGGWVTAETSLGPRFGVWMMPDNLSRGYLETFLALLVPENDGLWGFAQDVVDHVIDREARYATRGSDKAKIHSWLAWQADPGRQLHEAVKHKIFESSSPRAAPFVKWFRELFEL